MAFIIEIYPNIFFWEPNEFMSHWEGNIWIVRRKRNWVNKKASSDIEEHKSAFSSTIDDFKWKSIRICKACRLFIRRLFSSIWSNRYKQLLQTNHMDGDGWTSFISLKSIVEEKWCVKEIIIPHRWESFRKLMLIESFMEMID